MSDTERRIGKWMVARRCPHEPGRKTSRWHVHNVTGGDYLGVVEWYGRWRQYVFVPANTERVEIILAASCMQDLSAFVAALNAEQRAGSMVGGSR